MPRPSPRRPKKGKRPTSPHATRRSIWLSRDLFTEIVALAKDEERRSSDMIRVLIQRGLRATRGRESH
jgi:hypothetical protein